MTSVVIVFWRTVQHVNSSTMESRWCYVYRGQIGIVLPTAWMTAFIVNLYQSALMVPFSDIQSTNFTCISVLMNFNLQLLYLNAGQCFHF